MSSFVIYPYANKKTKERVECVDGGVIGQIGGEKKGGVKTKQIGQFNELTGQSHQYQC